MPDLRPGEGDELVTKGFLRAELAAFRDDLRADMTGLRHRSGNAVAILGSLRADLLAFERRLTHRVYAMLAAQTVIVSAVFVIS